MDFEPEEDFTFETAPFPPTTQIDDEILPNPTISTVVNCIISLPTDPSSPFVTLATSLPNPINNSNTNSGSYLVSVPGLLDNEVNHAKQVLKLFPAFSEVRRRIVPRFVNDEKFWQAYFTLLAIQTRYETRQQAMFGSGDGDAENNSNDRRTENDDDDDGRHFDNNNNNAPPTQRELAMMTARVVLRMPTPGFVFKNINKNNKSSSATNHHQDPNHSNNNNTIENQLPSSASSGNNTNNKEQQQQQQEEDHVFSSSSTTRIVPGRRLKVPPSLCIAVRAGGGTTNEGPSSSLLSSTATMLMGKDLMTKHMRDEWRKCLNSMCEFEI